MPDRRSYIDENGDAAELDEDFFADAVRGLPPALADAGREQVSITLDSDVLRQLRAGGRDWQARVNALLRRALELQS